MKIQWRKLPELPTPVKGFIGAVMTGLIGSVIWDVGLNHCKLVCGPFEDDPYNFQIIVGSEDDGLPQYGFANQLFRTYRKELAGKVQLDFEPDGLEQTRFCESFDLTDQCVENVVEWLPR